jgi:hypothetical protein
VVPKYPGGDPKGRTVYIPAAYHQMIHTYLQKKLDLPFPRKNKPAPKPDPSEVEEKLRELYRVFPIPGGYP